MQTYNIVIAKLTDLQDVLSLNKMLFEYEKNFSSTYNSDWTTSDRGVTYFSKRIEAQSVLLAQTDKAICGYACFHIDSYPFRNVNPIAELENMFVIEDHRSKGVGTMLIESMRKICSKGGVKRMKVGVLSSNAKALEFYKKSQFQMHEHILEQSLDDLDESKG